MKAAKIPEKWRLLQEFNINAKKIKMMISAQKQKAWLNLKDSQGANNNSEDEVMKQVTENGIGYL